MPESPNYRNARTPRTPRTPQLKDPTQTPRFYPVVKEGRTIDAKVRCPRGFGLHVRVTMLSATWEVFGTPASCLGWPQELGRLGGKGVNPGEKTLTPLSLADPPEEEDEAQFKPPHGMPRWLGDGLPGTQASHCLHQVFRRAEEDGKGPERDP